ncbi:MAG: hypothetical protein ACD_27C00052G0001 [uncultured bacterium]|nr:MAG: hypothetical protein ACD_27C00052G0001 [uncultured bacterium]
MAILPVSEKVSDYAQAVFDTLKKNNIRVEYNTDAESLGKKIRNAEAQKIPYMLILGEKEAVANMVSVRGRGEHDFGQMTQADFIAKISLEITSKSINTQLV